MFSSPSHQRINGKGRQKPGKIIILAALLVILALLLPAAMAENVSGTSANATTAANTLPDCYYSDTTQPAITTTISTATATNCHHTGGKGTQN